MNYRERRKEECQKLFEGFYPVISNRCRNPERVVTVYELARDGYFSHEIAEMLGTTPKAVQKIYRRYNFPNLYNFCPPRLEERPNYKNGCKTDRSGHIYKICPNHPYGSKYGSYVPLHRLVMEEHLGRYLNPEEVVHHIDGNPANNNIENLELFANNAEHLAQTLKGKCPKWTEQRIEKIKNRRKKRKRDCHGRYAAD